MDGIEVWNSAWSPANERAVELWHTLLVGGNRKFAVASTDFHRGGNIASPHTVVRAEALSAEAVIDAIAAGRSYVARDTSAEIGMQVRNSATPVQHADIGDTLLRSGGMQAEFRSNTAGRLRLTDQQGWFSDTPRRGRQHDRPDQPHLYPASADHAVPAARIKRSYRHKKAPSSDGAFA